MDLIRSNRVFSPQKKRNEASSELRFITELGRRLLVLVHPKKVAKSVSAAIRNEVGAESCVLVVELESIGLVLSASNSAGEEGTRLLQKRRFSRWMRFLPPQVSIGLEDEENFLVSGGHKFEYVSPIQINGKICGALILAFSKKNDCTEKSRSLIDATAQMTAMNMSLSAHYEAKVDASIVSAKEEHRKFTETVLDALPVSLYVIDRNYRIVTWNRHREVGDQGLLRDSVIGRNVFEILTKYPRKELFNEFEKTFRTGQIQRIEQQTTDENGATKHWLVSKIPMRDKEKGDVTHVITVGEDVTMRVEAMHAVGRADKLAAVGRLAAGVVHEINNPLATISACAEALESRVAEGVFNDSPDIEDLREYLGLIRNEAFRCKSITNGLLDFSRVRSGDRSPVSIGDTIRSSVKLISHQNRGGKVEIRVEEEKDLPMVAADEGQIQQAIIALATNAIDAMPNSGTLTFKTLSEKNQVIIEVKDTGNGIEADDLSKIFEPFFTTKGIGEGTGLGLAVCYGIITEHGGRLSVRSSVGVGTTFTISLPAHKE